MRDVFGVFDACRKQPFPRATPGNSASNVICSFILILSLSNVLTVCFVCLVGIYL